MKAVYLQEAHVSHTHWKLRAHTNIYILYIVIMFWFLRYTRKTGVDGMNVAYIWTRGWARRGRDVFYLFLFCISRLHIHHIRAYSHTPDKNYLCLSLIIFSFSRFMHYALDIIGILVLILPSWYFTITKALA